MKYTSEEALSEIQRRCDRILCRRSCRILSCVSGGLILSLAVMIAFIPGKTGMISDVSIYGSFLLSWKAGGYVLIALIAFILGITVTLLAIRYKRSNGNWKEDNRT